MKLSGDRNQCPTCQEYFNSSYAFDLHRTGTYDPPQRRCLSTPEMDSKGMAKNKDGFWVSELMDGNAISSRGDTPRSRS